MSQQIVIKPIDMPAGSSIGLSGEYKRENGTMVRLTTYDKVIENKPLGPAEKLFRMYFSDSNPEYVLNYDEEEPEDRKLILFWRQHPIIKCEGNPNLRRAIFTLENRKDEEDSKVKILKSKGIVYNLVNNCSLEEMRDIAFLVGLNPIDKTSEEIFINLIDFETGNLMQDPSKFLNTYKLPDTHYQVIAKKAIALGIIETRKDFYYIKHEMIGAKFTDVLAYCKKNKKMYEEYIRKEVAKQDELPLDYDKPVKEMVGKFSKKLKYEEDQFDDEDKKIRVRAKELKIGTWHMKSLSNLEKEIKEIEEKQKQEKEQEVVTA